MSLGKFKTGVIIIIALILSLTTGFLDILINISSRPSGLSSFSALFSPLSATTIFSFTLYLALWFLVINPLGNFLRLEKIPLAISFGAFFGVTVTLLSSNNLIYSPLTSTDSFKLFVSLLCSISISIGAYFTTRFLDKMPRQKNVATAFMLTVPFLFAETALFLWLNSYRMGSFLAIATFFSWTAFVFILVLTTVLFYRLGRKINVVRSIPAFAALVVLSPILASALNTNSPSSDEFTKKDKPVKHVILLTVDTLRADALSCYGSEEVSTPNIDRLAKDGILFSNAISPGPWTLPSFSSIMTGQSPLVHMATKAISRLPDNFLTLAEQMRDSGYFTAAIIYNHFLKPEFNLSQGFLEYDFYPKNSIGNSIGVKLLEKFFPKQFELEKTTTGLTKLATDWVESNQDKDFFLWLHYYDPHVPYSPPPEFLPEGEPPVKIGNSFSDPGGIRSGNFTPSSIDKRWIKDLYLGEVRYVDENIGRFLDNLKKLGLYDESLIVFTSDHGEEFWEHGGYEHGHSLLNEVIRVPFIIKLPNSRASSAFDNEEGSILLPVNRKIDETVTTQSIMPTMLDICGIEYNGDHFSVGSLGPLWENSNSYLEKPIISAGLLYYEDQESVIFNGSKYIRFLETNREILYDLTRDPKEQISILNSSPQKAEKAKKILKEHSQIAEQIRENNGITSGKEVEFDQETREKLKSLGYLQ